MITKTVTNHLNAHHVIIVCEEEKGD